MRYFVCDRLERRRESIPDPEQFWSRFEIGFFILKDKKRTENSSTIKKMVKMVQKTKRIKHVTNENEIERHYLAN